MIKISISRELAALQPGFIAGYADRGHAISVFDHAPIDALSRATPSGPTPPGSDDPDAASTSTGPVSVDIGAQW
jgi:hypothetical protein